MADFNEIIGKVGELSDDELSTHRQSALDEFKTLQEQDATEDNVNRMTEIADFVSTLKEEEKAREARTKELAAAADDAASRIAELTDSTEEDEVEDKEVADEEDPVEAVKEDEEEKDKDKDKDKKDKLPAEFSDNSETEAVEAPTEEFAAKSEDKADEEEPAEETELSAEDNEKPEELASKDEAEDKADADAEADDEENKENEEDKLFTENTEENNVATTPDELSVQDAPESKSAGLEVTITAGADIPGYGLGAELKDLSEVSKAFSERLRAIGSRGTGNGEQHTVASFNIDYPTERRLVGGDRKINESRMDAVASPEAVVAAGGICAPLPVDDELITYGSTNRPVRDSLPRFNAERGGVIYLTPPTLADVDGAVSIWTLADDYAAIGAELPTDGLLPGAVPTRASRADVDPAVATALPTSVYPGHINGTGVDVDGPVKPCIRITCGEEIRAYVDAIPSCFTIGNMQARAYPELVEKHLELALVWQARFGEQRLLTRIGNLSTKVRTKATHGIARDFLNALSQAVAGFRSRHRLDENFRLHAILPVWFRDAIRADMLLQLAGDGQDATFGLTNATIDRWIAERGVNVTWALDGEEGQVFGDQNGAPTLSGVTVTPGTETDLVEFPDEVVWYLFPEGGFVFLDGGTLDLGIVRDSTLNSKNDYQIFVETFEGLIKRAPETFRVTTPLNILGATTGTVDPVVGS